MVGLGDLRPAHGARRRRRRVGRGHSSGHGNTAGRGHKGQKARTGGQRRPGFEGGQLPLIKRVPYKRGVRGAGSNHVGGGPRERMDVVNVGRLASFAAGTEVTPDALRAARLIQGGQVKILGGGGDALAHALVVKAHAFSKSAKERIEAAGGRVEVIGA
ncbi:MAG TPA: 50S ribosomal protein L15 [bacterium]|jgi:large subunit ribosomal protein L15|nr:50S ribosomal protein L15 [bacterium]